MGDTLFLFSSLLFSLFFFCLMSLVNSILEKYKLQTSGEVIHPYPDEPYPFVTTMERTTLKHFIDAESERFHVQWYNRSGGKNLKRNALFVDKFGPHCQPVERTPSDNFVMYQDQLGAKRGRKTELTMNEIYLCHRFDKPTESRRQNVRHENIPCECQAKIIVHCGEREPTKARVTFFWRHTGHVPRSKGDMLSAPLPRQARMSIDSLVDQSLTWRNVKEALRRDRATLETMLFGDESDMEVSVASHIGYQEIYYAMSKAVRRKSRLDDDMKVSLSKWTDKIESDGNGFCFLNEDLDCVELGAFSFAFMSRWQYNV
ncbi:hypothetical protein BC940DRAFT_15886 [Gongronella butleri]|nr:hypothetical protein BC940DRAFT_15886 [Gongronella butleri]